MNDRYARHALIAGWQQEALAGATVLIAGVGALGNEAARLLALAGVGRLVLCDPDLIETSNLSRTSLFRPSDVGGFKAERAAEALRSLVPGLEIEARNRALINGLGLAELRDASLVLGCLDSRAARLQLNGRCQLVGASWIDGGTRPWGGEVRFFEGNESACYGCTLGESGRANLGEPWSCLDEKDEQPTGASAPLSALVGASMASFAVRHLMGLSIPRGALVIDGTTGRARSVALERDPSCPFHNPLPATKPVAISASSTVGELRARLEPGDIPLLWASAQRGEACGSCGFSRSTWCYPPWVGVCPSCEATLIPQSTVELSEAPETLRLRDLGVAPGEILVVRRGKGFGYIELGSGL